MKTYRGTAVSTLIVVFFVFFCGFYFQRVEAATVPGIPETVNLFKTDLNYGKIGAEVTLLQRILKIDPRIYTSEKATGYFGNITKQAVIRFQEKYKEDILTPLGLTNGTGFVGGTTRAKLNELYGNIDEKLLAEIEKLDVKRRTELAIEFDEIQKSLKETGRTWRAGYNEIFIKSDEYKKNLCGLKEPPAGTETKLQAEPPASAAAAEDLPDFFDWRDQHGEDYITPIKDQGSCGSCWAFGAVAVLEGAANAYYNNPNLDLNLSEQDLVSCYLGDGCSGAYISDIEQMFADYLQNNGVASEQSFPYQATNRSCVDKNPNWQAGAWRVVSYEDSELTGAAIKRTLIEYGPVEVGMIVYSDFPSYVGGIYRPHPSSWERGGHAVAIVGYGFDESEGEYWIVKNSWGTDWGETGYFRIAAGECGIEDWFAYAAEQPEPLTAERPEKICNDNDRDGYCNWGLGEKPASACPVCNNLIKDCDDSDPEIFAGCGLTPRGILFVSSNPTDASVYYDDGSGRYSYIGQTPVTSRLLVGRKKIKIAKQGYYDYIDYVNIVEGQTINLNTTLMPRSTGIITVLSPQEDRWVGGETYNITWDFVGSVGTVNIVFIGLNNNYDEDYFVVVARDVPASSEEYSWAIPLTLLDQFGEFGASIDNSRIWVGEYQPTTSSGYWDDFSEIADSGPHDYGEFWLYAPCVEGSHGDIYEREYITVISRDNGGVRFGPSYEDRCSGGRLIQYRCSVDYTPEEIAPYPECSLGCNHGECERIRITSPAPNEEWIAGSVHNIVWELSPGLEEYFNAKPIDIGILFYDDDQGRTQLEPITTEALNANSGHFSWTIPDSAAFIPGYLLTIEIHWEDGASQSDFFSVLSISDCTDSDDGRDYYERGTIRVNDEERGTDICSGGLLIEYYCQADGSDAAELYDCAYGCQDGVCLPEPEEPVCTDSDGGIDYFVRGTVSYTEQPTGIQKTATDVCTDSNRSVLEYSCRADGSLQGDTRACLQGCRDGACLPEPEPTCTDSDGGIYPAIKGSVTTVGLDGVTHTEHDECYYNNTRVQEKYCNPDNTIGTQIHSCDPYDQGYICSDGACTTHAGPTSCTDSDGGLDYYTYGVVTTIEWNGEVGHADQCLGEDEVNEKYCMPDNTAGVMGYYCPDHLCLEGRCIRNNSWCEGADINKDHKVDAVDLGVVSTFYDRTNCGQINSWCWGADINKDHKVDYVDLGILSTNYDRLDCAGSLGLLEDIRQRLAAVVESISGAISRLLNLFRK